MFYPLSFNPKNLKLITFKHMKRFIRLKVKCLRLICLETCAAKCNILPQRKGEMFHSSHFLISHLCGMSSCNALLMSVNVQPQFSPLTAQVMLPCSVSIR